MSDRKPKKVKVSAESIYELVNHPKKVLRRINQQSSRRFFPLVRQRPMVVEVSVPGWNDLESDDSRDVRYDAFQELYHDFFDDLHKEALATRPLKGAARALYSKDRDGAANPLHWLTAYYFGRGIITEDPEYIGSGLGLQATMFALEFAGADQGTPQRLENMVKADLIIKHKEA